MPVPSNGEIFDAWKNQPAPLLPVLHAYQDRDGYLSEDVIRSVSGALRIPVAELYGTITFYHHFSRSPEEASRPRVCTGPICCQRGALELCDTLNGHPMPCAGRCDEPIPVLGQGQIRTGLSAGDLVMTQSPLPPRPPDGTRECVFASIRERGRHRMSGYRRTRGYLALERALRTGPGSILEEVSNSQLAGRGGAGFPTGTKWRAVRDAPAQPKTVVCNADEGEPGCFKDRALMDHDPHAVLEGMLIAGYAAGATVGFIYLRYEYPQTLSILTEAIREARDAGLLGQSIMGTDFEFDIHVRRGAGAYICGEEGSLLNSLEGKHPFPRNRPPFPVTHGYENRPTIVNNVETLASVPPIIEQGAEWYRGLGEGKLAGTKVISLSGDIRMPGNYEVPMGFPLRTLIDEWAGGLESGRTLQAVTMAGLSGGFLGGDALNVTLDEPSIRAHGSFLGAGGIMVFDDRRDMREIARQAMAFFAEESCGKCFPCRIGTQRLTERLSGDGPGNQEDWIREVSDIGRTMRATSACGLGMAAPLVTDSLLKFFPEALEPR